MKKNTKIAIVVAIFVVVLAAATLLAIEFMPKGVEGEKTITVSVVTEEETADFTITTTKEFLGEALTDEELVKGDMGEFGLYITEVNGVTADESLQQWWRISKDGVDTTTSADATPIADGEKYELTLSTW